MNERQQIFELLNSFFDKVYVITLKRATERHQHIEKELQGLRYNLFWGQDKKDFSIDDLKEKNIYNEEKAKHCHRYNKPLKPGQVGCAWSHALVYEAILDNNYQKVLIFEDDIAFNSTNLSLLPIILNELPHDWELFYLGFSRHEKKPPLTFIKLGWYHVLRFFKTTKYTHCGIDNLYPKPVGRFIYKAGFHNGTYAYALTQSGAKKLLELQQPISFSADDLLAYTCINDIIKGYVILPQIINHLNLEYAKTQSYLND